MNDERKPKEHEQAYEKEEKTTTFISINSIIHKKKTHVVVKPRRVDRILVFLCSNVSAANCGSSLTVILNWVTRIDRAAMASVSANLSKKRKDNQNFFDLRFEGGKRYTFDQYMNGLLHIFQMKKNKSCPKKKIPISHQN